MAKGDTKVTSPVPGFHGEVVGVRFVDGVATIPAGQKVAALEYFARHRYAIDREVEVGGDDGITVPASGSETALELTDEEGLAKLKSAELDTIAGTQGVDVSAAANKGEKAHLIAEDAKAKALAASPTGAPVGDQDNTGHDAAGPDPIAGTNADAEADPAQGQV